MPLAKDDDVIEQVSAAGADPAFGDPVLRVAKAGSLRFDAKALYRFDNFVIEVGCMIEDEIAWRRV
jgi:hypothetical protein